MRERWPRIGMEKLYRVAPPRKSMPRELERSTGKDSERVRDQKIRKTTGQARPTRSRLAPVMLATARWAFSGFVGAVQAKYRSTAYSGSTAMRARTTRARVADTSVSA